MSDFEDKLNSILSSPDEMEKIISMARSLSESMSSKEENGDNKSEAPELTPATVNLDPKMLKVMGRLMGEYNSTGSDKKQLLDALKPYLRQDRWQKIDRAVEIAKLAHLAKIAISEFSGGDKDL